MHTQTDGVFRSLIFLPKLLMSVVLHGKYGLFVQLFFGEKKKEVQCGTANNVKIGLWILNNNLPTLVNLNLSC